MTEPARQLWLPFEVPASDWFRLSRPEGYVCELCGAAAFWKHYFAVRTTGLRCHQCKKAEK